MSNFTNISSQIAVVLNAIQINSVNAFAEVDQYPNINFTGYPAATIAPSDNESDYATIVQNLRTYTFFVDLYISVQKEGYEQAFSDMSLLADATLNALDNCNDLNNSAQIVRPVPSSWAIIYSNMGTLITARILLKAAVTVDTNNG